MFRRGASFFLAAAILGGIAPSGAVAAKRVDPNWELSKEIAARCNEILMTGLFHDESFACIPGLRQATEQKLCSSGTDPFFPYAAGFGSGARLLPGAGASFHGAALFQQADWNKLERYLQDCPKGQPSELVLSGDIYEDVGRVLDHWEAERAKLPISMRGPWEACAAFQWRESVGRKAEVQCHAIDPFDVDGEDDWVYFQAAVIVSAKALDAPLLPPLLLLPRYRAARLRADLEVLGAECESASWKKGMRFGSGALRCRRDGRSPVTFRLSTTKGSCTAELSELTEPSWQALCEATAGD